jgi:hypothetical protein
LRRKPMMWVVPVGSSRRQSVSGESNREKQEGDRFKWLHGGGL